jgi:hypothetical protein
MPYLDGTRSATAACDISLSYNILVYPNDLVPFVARKLGYVDGSIGGVGTHTGAYSTWTWSWISTPHAPTWQWFIYLTMVSNDGYGHSTTVVKTVASGTENFATEWVDVSATLTGSWSCTVGTDKLWDITEAAYSISTAPTVFPPATNYRWYEMSRYGSTPSCTLTIGGTSCTATGAYTSGARKKMLYIFGLIYAGICQDEATAAASVSNYLVNGVAPYAASHSHTFGGQSATNWAITMSAATYDVITVDLSSYARIAATCALNTRIRAWDGAYPDSLTCRITGFDAETTGYRDVTGTGSISSSDTFYKYSAVSDIVKNSTSDSETTALDSVPISVTAAITGASLTTNGDSNTNTRVMFRGWRFTGWSIAETNNRSISGTGNDRTYSPFEGMSGYRYLDVQVKAQTGTSVPGVITLTDYHGNTKEWNVVGATTSYATVTLDLCSPDSHSLAAIPDKDAKDNPYPRKNTTSTSFAGSESVDSAYWGITSCQRLRVSSGAIDIGTTILKYTNTDSTYVPDTVTSSFERITPSIVAEVGTTTYYYGRRFWQQDRDGRNEEESDVHWQMTVGGSTGVTTYSVSMLTIAQLAAQVNASDVSIVRHPGWVMTRSVVQPGGGTCAVSQPPLRDCYLNGDTGYATWLYGGGALLTPNATSGTDFSYGHQITAGTITAQTLFDSINGDFPPDLYDPFDINGGTDSALYLGGVSLLRGIAHGGLLDTNGEIVTTGTVDLIRTSDSSNRGSDSTIDAQGRYYTGTPWGLGEVNHHVDYVTKSQNINPVHTSHRHRVWFRDVLQDIFSAIEAFKNKGFLMLGKATKINVRWQDNPLTERLPGTVITSDNIVKLRDSDNNGDYIFILIKGSTSYTLSYTTDNGATKGDYLTVTAGTAGFECDTNRGLLIIIYDDGTTSSPGNIKYRLSRDQGTTWTTAANCTINSVTPQVGKVLDTSYDPHLGGMLYAIFDIGGTKKVCRSTDLGATWEVVLT